MNTKTPLLSFDEALSHLRKLGHCKVGVEDTALMTAYGRVLAEDIIATCDQPPLDNSAMDGYAISRSLNEAKQTSFPVVMDVYAGSMPETTLKPGEAARIFTGAPVPEGTGFVAPQEDCLETTFDGVRLVKLSRSYQSGCNIRRQGEDQKKGAPIVRAGASLRPQEIAAAASIGMGQVKTYKRLKVGVFSTGNELIRPGTSRKAGQIFDANHFLLRGMLANLPVELIDLGILVDQREVVESALEAASKQCDVILTSGGAGGGDKDFVSATLGKLGKTTFWHLAVKPGRPFMVGELPKCVFIGLPGNPVAATVAFAFLARPLIEAIAGGTFKEASRQYIPANFEILNRKTGRREFLRGRRVQDGGAMKLSKYHSDGSALLSSLTFADGFIEISEEVSSVCKGDLLPFISFDEIGLI
ncbi:Molybdopterin molybdenumtransferase [Pseudovibrio axinellae]|uniref:Molybdopterin molybdenumtransferase n=1 Tax=Pseudovibrio axinellae TaxID=989403 RepID=A0A161X9B7_9HYPH|nr:gephyrin-like molybdotransferase Glp [Pseudovibrio axinellae]KZL08495.1 Molybdopterin molybdenumtransferase [Pseudovibrio axinellae]SEP76163.1 molybdopterin molybdochelatase [Pseudovibrio axinellae]